ncbi:MAG: hypothetical protein D6729_11200 [Deltaproteobacteria bacterium]|nr:MAG: hypothetical protein D6729_11200 [Deltaproteobacteria bacterium]
MIARVLAKTAHDHPLLLLGATLGLTLLLGLLASRLHVQTAFDALLPQDAEEVRDLETVNAQVGGIGYIVVVVDGADPERVSDFVQRFAREASSLPGIRYVEHAFDPAFFEQRALLLLSPREIDELNRAIENRIVEEKKKANPLFVDLLDDGTGQKEDAPSLEALERRYRAKMPATNRLVSKDGRRAYLLLKPTGLSGDLAFGEALLPRVEALARRLGARVGYGEAEPMGNEVRVRLTGNYVIRVEENRVMLSDLNRASWLALVLSVGLVTLWTRRWISILLVGLPLVCGVAWTFGLTALLVGEINIVTGFLAAILVGLGIDFGIHLLMRFGEERRHGKTVDEALERAIAVTGRAALTGAMTTSAAFLTLAFAEFQGFSQFGEVAAGGVLVAILATYLVAPPLYVLAERFFPTALAPAWEPPPIARVAHPALLAALPMALGTGLFAYSLQSLGELRFVTDMRQLQGRLPAVALQDEILGDLNLGTAPAIALARTPEGAAAVAEAARKIPKDDPHRLAPGAVVSLTDVVPLDQEARARALRRLRKTLSDPAVDALPEEEREKVRSLLEKTRAQPFTVEEAPEYIRHRFLPARGRGALTLLSPPTPLYETRDSIRWARTLQAAARGARVQGHSVWIADENRIAARIFELIQEDGPRTFWLALGAVFLLLVLDLRHLGRAVLVMLPLALGLVGIAGLMRLFRVDLNFLNAVMVPAIIGIGIDNAVHIYHRYRDEGPGSIGRVLRHTGSAALLATLTTAIGFGTLVTAHHDGLASVGWLALLGLGSTFFSTTLFFPALLWTLERIGAPSGANHAPG